MKHDGGKIFADAISAADRGRESVRIVVRLRVGDAKRSVMVHVRNISVGGLMAELPRPVAPDATVKVDLPGIGWVSGRVAWQTEGRIGIAFAWEIDPALLRRQG